MYNTKTHSRYSDTHTPHVKDHPDAVIFWSPALGLHHAASEEHGRDPKDLLGRRWADFDSMGPSPHKSMLRTWSMERLQVKKRKLLWLEARRKRC